MTEQKAQFQTISVLSNQLLHLEPIFNGTGIREDLLVVKKKFQKVVLELFIQLEAQVRRECYIASRAWGGQGG